MTRDEDPTLVAIATRHLQNSKKHRQVTSQGGGAAFDYVARLSILVFPGHKGLALACEGASQSILRWLLRFNGQC